MGTITRIGRFRVVMHLKEHNPPHVHIQGPDFELSVSLDGELLEGPERGFREAAQAVGFVLENREALLRMWEERTR